MDSCFIKRVALERHDASRSTDAVLTQRKPDDELSFAQMFRPDPRRSTHKVLRCLKASFFALVLVSVLKRCLRATAWRQLILRQRVNYLSDVLKGYWLVNIAGSRSWKWM